MDLNSGRPGDARWVPPRGGQRVPGRCGGAAGACACALGTASPGGIPSKRSVHQWRPPPAARQHQAHPPHHPPSRPTPSSGVLLFDLPGIDNYQPALLAVTAMWV